MPHLPDHGQGEGRGYQLIRRLEAIEAFPVELTVGSSFQELAKLVGSATRSRDGSAVDLPLWFGKAVHQCALTPSQRRRAPSRSR